MRNMRDCIRTLTY